MFSLTYKSLSVLSNIVFLVIFPPAIAISNLFSHGVFLSIMNIFLSIGYGAKFIKKIGEGEISRLDLAISLLFLCLSLVITFYLAPTISIVHIIDVIGLVNLVATGVNSFFLVINLLLPPFEAFIRYVSGLFGYEIKTNFFKKTPMSLEHDRPVLDRLLRKFYGHDSFSDEFKETEMMPFNNILSVFSHYINKANEPFLGNLINHDRISYLENAVSQLIINGNTDNSIVFINRKIDFKRTKINLLNKASSELMQDKKEEKRNVNYAFFEKTNNISENEIYDAGLSLLTKEINRQHEKIVLLKACLPMSLSAL